MHPADDVADLLALALPVAGGAQGVIEHDDPLGAADLFNQRLAFRVVDPPDFVLIEEIADPGGAIDKAEPLALELETVGQGSAVMDLDPMGFVVAALALVAAARLGDLGHELLAGVGEINQLGFDRVGGGVQLGDVGHRGPPQRGPLMIGMPARRDNRTFQTSPPRKPGSRAIARSLALDSRFRGNDDLHTTPASRSRFTSSGSTPHSSPSRSAVCSPSNGGRVTTAGESDNFTGHPTV